MCLELMCVVEGVCILMNIKAFIHNQTVMSMLKKKLKNLVHVLSIVIMCLGILIH